MLKHTGMREVEYSEQIIDELVIWFSVSSSKSGIADRCFVSRNQERRKNVQRLVEGSGEIKYFIVYGRSSLLNNLNVLLVHSGLARQLQHNIGRM